MKSETPLEFTAGLNSDDVRWYVLGRGWKPQSTNNPSLMVFNNPIHHELQLQIPTAGAERDVRLLMGEVIRKLSAAENRSIPEVSHDLRHPFEDILRLRVRSKSTDAGTLPLDEGLRLYKGGRETLLSAACWAHLPQAYYLRKTYKPVEEFIKRCQVGQTGIGSYVMTILTPPMAPAAPPSLFDRLDDKTDKDDPFERRVMLSLMRGLNVLESAVQIGDVSLIENGVASGVSADLCDGLSSILTPDDQAFLQVDIGWSPVRSQVPPDVAKPVRFASSDLAFIGEAGRKLRRKVLRSETVEGRVEGLKMDPMLIDQTHGNVTLRSVVDGKSSSIRIALSEEDYVAACKAHLDKKRVRVTGTLRLNEKSKLFELDDATDFTIVTNT